VAHVRMWKAACNRDTLPTGGHAQVTITIQKQWRLCADVCCLWCTPHKGSRSRTMATCRMDPGGAGWGMLRATDASVWAEVRDTPAADRMLAVAAFREGTMPAAAIACGECSSVQNTAMSQQQWPQLQQFHNSTHTAAAPAQPLHYAYREL
jgi:hypothetical protein